MNLSGGVPSKGERVVTTVAYDHQIFSMQQFGGVSRYFCEVASRVQAVPGWDSVVVAPMHVNEHLADTAVRQLGIYVPRRVPAGPLRRAVNTFLAPPILMSTGAQLLHRTYYGCRPRPGSAKVVATVFDMIHEISPHYFPSRDRSSALKRRAVADADAIVCISHSTARDLQRLLAVPSEKISVTHLGFSSAFARTAPVVGARPGADRPYLLYVGHRGGYKNFARLLKAYGASARLPRDFDLIAFGGLPFSAEELARIAALKVRPDSVRRQVGQDQELARAYAGAHALVYPSEYEGFGIPLLEAMGAGCPVICSNSSSMPEVVEDAGEYFNPHEVESMGHAIERVAYDEDHRQALARRGRIRCQAFSWDRCAAETVAVYRRLLP